MVGRDRDPVRSCFIETEDTATKKKYATCKHCGKKYVHNTSRMRNHIVAECKSVPGQTRARYLPPASATLVEQAVDDPGTVAAGSSLASTALPPGSTSSSSALLSPTLSARSRSSLDRYVDITTEEEIPRLNEAFACAVYASGLPLSSFNTEFWTNFFSLLRPSYVLPSPYQLGGPLLNAQYGKCKASNDEKVQNAVALGIMTDSYTNVRNESVINIIVTTPEPVLHKQIFRGQERETGEYVGRELVIVIREVGPNKVLIIVTDNASNMQVSWEVVISEFPHITAIGCASHCWDLLFKDIIDLVSIIARYYDYARAVVRFIKKSSNVMAVFSFKQKEKYGNRAITLKLHAKTRWGGAVILINSVIKNKAALQETVISENLDVKRNVRKCVLENKFWDRLKCISDILTPIHASITLIESNRALLSDVYFLHSKINQCVTAGLQKIQLSMEEEVEVQDLLSGRKKFTIAPIHMASYMLDPRFRGDGLLDEEIGDAITFISTFAERREMDAGRVIANLGEFRTGVGFFSTPSILAASNSLHPSVWWRGVCSTQPLASIAADLLSMPPTAAECERRWSDHGFIHSKSRNRLLNQRVTKLVTTRMSLLAGRASAKAKSQKPLNREELEDYFLKYTEHHGSGHRQEEGGEGEAEDEISEGEDSDWEPDEPDEGDEEDWDFNSDEEANAPQPPPPRTRGIGARAEPQVQVQPQEQLGGAVAVRRSRRHR